MTSKPRTRARVLLTWVGAALAAAAATCWAQSAATPEAVAPILEAAREAARSVAEPFNRMLALVSVAEASAQCGSHAMATELIQEAEEAAAADPSTRDQNLLQVGEACVRAGLLDEAVGVAGLMGEGQNAVQVLSSAATALLAAGRRDEALRVAAQARDRAVAERAADAAGKSWISLAAFYRQAGMTAEFGAALDEGLARLSRSENTLASSPAIQRIVQFHLDAGQTDPAIAAARQIPRAESRVPALCSASEALVAQGDPSAALDVLGLARQAASADPEPLICLNLLARVAESYRKLGQPGAARDTMLDAERMLNAIGDHFRFENGKEIIGQAYIVAGDFDAAERVIRSIGNTAKRANRLIELAVNLANGEHYDRAVQVIRTVEPGAISVSGSYAITSVAQAYYRLLGDETDMTGIASSEVRDAVTALRAKSLTERGRYGEAIALAKPIQFVLSRDEALGEVARRCLDTTTSSEGLAPVREVLGLLSSHVDGLRLRARLAGKLTDLGREGEALDMLRALDEDLANQPVDSLRADLYGTVAAGYSRLGRTKDAREAALKAVGAAMNITCGSCRDHALSALFTQLAGADFVELALAAAERMEVPRMRAENLLRLYETSTGLSAAQLEKLARAALAPSAQTDSGPVRASSLAKVAIAYYKHGLALTEAERRTLREAAAAQLASATPLGTPGSGYVPPAETPLASRPPAVGGEAPGGRPAVIRLVFFKRPGCPTCAEVRDQLADLRRQYPRLALETFDIETSEQAKLLNVAICRGLGIPEQQHLVAPAVFSARRGLIGSEVTPEALRELAYDARGLPSPSKEFRPQPEEARADLAGKFEKVGLLVVLSAGLADGINPCAFTVIIFFLAYLAHIGKDRRQIAAAGVVFTVAVFVTYLAAGAGLAGLVSVAQQTSRIVQRAVYGVTAALALLAAVLSFRDGLRARAGRAEEMTLSLPDSLKKRIRLTISRQARMGLTVAATALLGGTVALFELPCTGQMYLPVIVYALHHLQGRFWEAFAWLVLYNLCFIAPLVVVFIAVFFGLTSERLTTGFRRHIATTKFAMAALFAALGIFMLTYLV